MKSWTIRRLVIYVLAVAAILAVAGTYSALPKGIAAMQVYADGEETEEVVSVYAGMKKTLSCTIEPESFADRKVTYQVADEEIVSVDENGEITGLKEGETVVTAQAVDFKQNITVKVESAVLDIKGLEKTLDILEDDGYTLEPEVVMASKDLKAPEVKFKSKDKSIATIDKNGYILGIAPGKTTITVTAGNITKKVTLTVMERPVEVYVPSTPAPAANTNTNTNNNNNNNNNSDNDDGGGGWEG